MKKISGIRIYEPQTTKWKLEIWIRSKKIDQNWALNQEKKQIGMRFEENPRNTQKKRNLIKVIQEN